MSQEMGGSFPEYLIRKATNVVRGAKTNNRVTLLRRLTKPNKDSMAALMEEKALFAANNERAAQEILLDETIQPLFPDDFFENPTAWIEAQPRLISPEQQTGLKNFSGKIRSILSQGHNADIERVKRIELRSLDGETVTLVSKRLNPKFDDWHEVEAAQRAHEHGIPTPRVFGRISDRGNHYALFEYIPSIDFEHIQKTFGIGDAFASFEAFQAVGERFFSGEKKGRFMQLVHQAKELRHYFDFERELKEGILEKVKFSLPELQDGVESAEQFFQSLCVRIEDILPTDPEIEAYILAAQFATKDAFVMQMAVWTIEAYAHTSIGSAEEQPIFSEIVKGTAIESDERLERTSAALNWASTLCSRAPEIPFRSMRDASSAAKEQLKGLIQTEIFGTDGVDSIKRQMKEIRQRCKTEHLAPYNEIRIEAHNVAIAWDGATDRPRRRTDGSIEIYVLDWERPVGSPALFVRSDA